MRIAMTGATGLLGSNLLLEIIKDHLSRLDDLEIILLGRQKSDCALAVRVREIVLGAEGLAYLALGEKNTADLERFLSQNVWYVDYNLNARGLDIGPEGMDVLRKKTLDGFFHLASLTDFRNTSDVRTALMQTNVDGTRQILALLKKLRPLEYIHVGTAYACGYRGGRLPADVSDLSVKFRNPYEESKLRAEIMVREFCAKEKIRLRVFRPSTICGRVIESPHGAVTKFDVFYSWVAWMLRMKKKAGINGDLYVRPFDIPLRIACRSDSGLNIVPADYSAKVVYQVFIQKDPGESYYLVSNEETAHRDYVSWMLKLVNARGTSFVDQPPDEKNNAEAFYYKTVGQIFTPYVTSDPMLFDASSLTTVLARSGLACPQMTQERFLTLMAYARSSDFGLHNK